MIPVLPDAIADLLDDATPASEPATNEEVDAFLDKHAEASRPEILAGWTKALGNHFAAHASRHVSTLSVLTGALKEARAGYFTAWSAVDAVRPLFLDEVAKPPASKHQNPARHGQTAMREFYKILSWAIAQANAADLDEIRARTEKQMPDNVQIVDAASFFAANGQAGTASGQTGATGGQAGTAAGSSGPAPVPTTWEPVDLGPWLSGTITLPKPTLGMARTDGQRLIYPGREHAILGETESGKTWLALGCVAAELLAGNLVVYIHYEEGDPGSTLERLQLLGVDGPTISRLLRFVAPSQPSKVDWVAALCTPAPTLVVHDGVNEAMALMGAEIKDVDGAALFRRRLVTPFRNVGAATIACDHMPLGAAPGRVEAFGSVHKGNALDGARIMLVNETPFGRKMRGVSHVFVTKDRPGHLRIHGQPTKIPGKTFVGTLVVDDEPVFTPFSMVLYAPKIKDPGAGDPASALADDVHDVITALPWHTVESMRLLFAQMRQAGHKFTEAKVKAAVDDLLVAKRLVELPGKRGANKYQAVVTAAATAADCGGKGNQ